MCVPAWLKKSGGILYTVIVMTCLGIVGINIYDEVLGKQKQTCDVLFLKVDALNLFCGLLCYSFFWDQQL